MKIVDANVLLHAVNSADPKHAEARTWLVSALSGSEPIGFAWVALLGFLRLSTRAAVFARPLTIEQAVAALGSWLAAPAAVHLNPTGRHLSLLDGLLRALGTGGNLVTDAHLAALALEHGAEVVSYDTDFARFTGLRWSMPSS